MQVGKNMLDETMRKHKRQLISKRNVRLHPTHPSYLRHWIRQLKGENFHVELLRDIFKTLFLSKNWKPPEPNLLIANYRVSI